MLALIGLGSITSLISATTGAFGNTLKTIRRRYRKDMLKHIERLKAWQISTCPLASNDKFTRTTLLKIAGEGGR